MLQRGSLFISLDVVIPREQLVYSVLSKLMMPAVPHQPALLPRISLCLLFLRRTVADTDDEARAECLGSPRRHLM
jgi:hypothetical protein